MTTDDDPLGERGLVYLHGAGLGPWIWEDHVRALDLPTLSTSFPDRGAGRPVPDDVGLRGYADHVRDQIADWSVDEVIVVAHSIGGVVGIEAISSLAEAVDDTSPEIVGFVGVCAAIPEPGGSFLSCYPLHQRLFQRIVTRVAGTKPPDSVIRKSLGNGLRAEQLNRITDEYTPESRRLYTDDTTAELPDVAILYVKTTDDNELSPARQDAMIANLGTDEVATVDAGHMPMLSHPDELAAILEGFVERVSADAQ